LQACLALASTQEVARRDEAQDRNAEGMGGAKVMDDLVAWLDAHL